MYPYSANHCFFFDVSRYSILPYLQYYMQDVVKVDSPEFWGSIMLGVLVISSIPASIIAGITCAIYASLILSCREIIRQSGT